MLWAGGFRTEVDLERYYEAMGPLYSRRYDPAAAAATRGRAIHSPEAINRAFGPNGFLRRLDLRPELARITAPTLILAGRHDWICPPEFSEEIHRLIPGSDLRIFEESSHSLRVDEPQKLIAASIGVAKPDEEDEYGFFTEIEHRRGRIRIAEPQALERASCKRYGVVRKKYNRLLGAEKCYE